MIRKTRERRDHADILVDPERGALRRKIYRKCGLIIADGGPSPHYPGVTKDKGDEPVPGKFVVKKGTTGKFRFNLLSANGQVVATSEAYNSKASAMGGIRAVRGLASDATIEDQTTKEWAAAEAARKAAGPAKKTAKKAAKKRAATAKKA